MSPHTIGQMNLWFRGLGLVSEDLVDLPFSSMVPALSLLIFGRMFFFHDEYQHLHCGRSGFPINYFWWARELGRPLEVS